MNRALDVTIAGTALVASSPLLAAGALAVKLQDGGPVLYRQQRVGEHGRRFTMLKFRSMVDDAERDGLAVWACENDPRITRVGRVLRRLRIDELPQILNILKFEMSWIGPRPEAMVLSHWYTDDIPFYRYRHVVKPGITGWAQINQGHVAGVDQVLEKLHYDFYYIKYFSPWLDVLIVFRTIKTMLTGWGAR